MDAASLYWIPWAIAAIGLAISIWVYFFKPKVRNRNLRRPVNAHFTIRDSRQSISGRDVSKGDPHSIRRLVLPSMQQAVMIEIGFWPRIALHVNEIVIAVAGDFSSRPRIVERTDHYVQSGAKPSTAKDYNADHVYHAYVDRDWDFGTHRVIGLKIKTKKAGLYPIHLDFITDEITGTFGGLEILVEDTPSTQMLCHAKDHGRNCLVSPIPLNNAALIADNAKFPAAPNERRRGSPT
jgi:hypothetical protein